MEHETRVVDSNSLSISQGFGSRLREERERTSLNQADFGALAGVARVAQANYERGLRLPTIEYIYALSGAGVDINFVLWGVRSSAGGAAGDLDCELLVACLTAAASEISRANLGEGGGPTLERWSTARLASLIYARAVLREPEERPRFVKDIAAVAVGMFAVKKPA